MGESAVIQVEPSAIDTLRQRFASARFLTFDSLNGLTRLNVSTPACTATIFLQGAHLVAFKPTGEQDVIFMSRKSDYELGKAFRGGVPVVFPWFATDSKKDRVDGHPGPSHGFARVQDWTLESAAMRGDAAELVLKLGPTAMSRHMGFDSFALTMRFRFAHTLTAELTVENPGTSPLEFEEAMHTYFHVTDIHETSIQGLEDTGYIDKVDNFTHKPAAHAPITFTGKVDRVYLDTAGPYVIRDGAGSREIHMSKQDSRSTITWNNGGPLPDLGEWDWHDYVALETGNVDVNRITLAPGEKHTMSFTAEVKRVK
ncbi:glucose-6-phosphate 1-epimerase [Bryocella elongata]|uniref:Putative glucose-6-phosphate 1-epimerase n=1 Tax=Bryocella elongata TaxID=863522 RepID=A0A1H5XY18_9BACT|nr:glucose-6-phosphate 1-epimerase [Bryocella elongata]